MERSVRLAEIAAALSLATDLGMGQPLEHELRTTLLAVRLGEVLGLTDEQLADVYYVALLRWIGCTSHSRQLTDWVGDDIEAHTRAARWDFGSPKDAIADMVRHAGAGTSPLRRARAIGHALREAPRAMTEFNRASCELAQRLAERMGFGRGVQEALGHIFERFDGKGYPAGIEGEEIALPARLVYLAQDAEIFARSDGIEAAVEVITRRSGRAYDPKIAETFCSNAAGVVPGSDAAWDAVLAAEPVPAVELTDERLDEALLVMADFADQKVACFAGRSRGVSALVDAAAVVAKLPSSDRTLVRRSALVHDLGRCGISNGIWEKPGALSDIERERVRMHPYLTERTLARPATLATIGAVASMHHERLSGDGYHRRVGAAQIPVPARLLAAADAYHAMLEPRPYRPAMPADRAADTLRREARSGKLDGDAVECVLSAAGHAVRKRREWPSGLTAREVEVLRLIARGQTNKQMATLLTVSEKTVGHHVEHIYTKIGVATRAGATLFAMENGLLGPES